MQAGQHEVLGAIYVPSQNNNSDSSHGQHRHNGGTGAGSHGAGGAGGGGSGGHGSHHGQGHANAQVDRRNINSYEITPTIINCRGTANFAKAKQYGRWIILHRNNPAEMMGQLVILSISYPIKCLNILFSFFYYATVVLMVGSAF